MAFVLQAGTQGWTPLPRPQLSQVCVCVHPSITLWDVCTLCSVT